VVERSARAGHRCRSANGDGAVMTGRWNSLKRALPHEAERIRATSCEHRTTNGERGPEPAAFARSASACLAVARMAHERVEAGTRTENREPGSVNDGSAPCCEVQKHPASKPPGTLRAQACQHRWCEAAQHLAAKSPCCEVSRAGAAALVRLRHPG
jgi:hypothetical protein